MPFARRPVVVLGEASREPARDVLHLVPPAAHLMVLCRAAESSAPPPAVEGVELFRTLSGTITAGTHVSRALLAAGVSGQASSVMMTLLGVLCPTKSAAVRAIFSSAVIARAFTRSLVTRGPRAEGWKCATTWSTLSNL